MYYVHTHNYCCYDYYIVVVVVVVVKAPGVPGKYDYYRTRYSGVGCVSHVAAERKQISKTRIIIPRNNYNNNVR